LKGAGIGNAPREGNYEANERIRAHVLQLSADVRFQVQNRVFTRKRELRMYHPLSNSTKTKVMQVT